VARKGRVAHFEAHGLMDIESQKPMAKDALFRLVPMSKAVTGTAIMMLVEEGKIRRGCAHNSGRQPGSRARL